MPAKK